MEINRNGILGTISRLFGGNDKLQTQTAERVETDNVVIYRIGGGGSGGAAAAADMIMYLAQAFYSADKGTPLQSAPKSSVIDLDAEAEGTADMVNAAVRINTLASADHNGRGIRHIEAVNTAIAHNMEGSDENTCIGDMIDQNSAHARNMADIILTEEELHLPRKVGGQGRSKLAESWGSVMFRSRELAKLFESIVNDYRNNKKILIQLSGSCTGAMGVAVHNLLPQEIYRRCNEVNPNLIDNLKIHEFVIEGYTIHPAEDSEDEAFVLDNTHDEVRRFYFNQNEARKMVDVTYHIATAAPVVAYEKFARGGKQYRHYSLGDMLLLSAKADSARTAFESGNEKGRHKLIVVDNDENDPRFKWSDIHDKEFERMMVNYIRFCAVVCLRLKPLTYASYDEVKVAPHIVALLGKKAEASRIETLLEPFRAMISLAETALRFALDVGATGTDWSADKVDNGYPTLVDNQTVLFNPAQIKRILCGTLEDEVNFYDLDSITQYSANGGTSYTVTTDITVGSAFDDAADNMEKGETAVDFLLELYHQASI
ncbi:MAG: hypothetical protein IJO95_05460 [Clostridia bacterium]|nr:hypothetical protein [Clostridia bacterium]